MSQIEKGNTSFEFSCFDVPEILSNKETSHDPGEYNEIRISGGLLAAEAEEESSDSEDTSSSSALTGSIGMIIGVGGIVIGTVGAISASMGFLSGESVIGISQAQCAFSLENADYQDISVRLKDGSGAVMQTASLLPGETEKTYVAEFSGLIPDSVYYLEGIDDDGDLFDLGEGNSFRTLPIPNYEISVDESRYDKQAGIYDLSFVIDNPHGYEIEALLCCEADETLNSRLISSEGLYRFTLPSILSSYRLQLYQEGYLVGQTSWSDFQGVTPIEETVDIGISSLYMGVSLGEVGFEDIEVSILSQSGEDASGALEVGMDGYVLYIMDYDLEPDSPYTLRISDMSRPSFTYLSYPFKTLPIPHYEIAIDYSGFSLEEGVYDVSFSISNPEGRYIEAYLSCLSDPSLDDLYYFMENTIEVTLPSPYSVYRLDLTQDGFAVGSVEFSACQTMALAEGTFVCHGTSFSTQIELGDVPLGSFLAYLNPVSFLGDRLVLEIAPVDGYNRVYLAMEGLEPNEEYELEIVDPERESFVYLSHSFATSA